MNESVFIHFFLSIYFIGFIDFIDKSILSHLCVSHSPINKT